MDIQGESISEFVALAGSVDTTPQQLHSGRSLVKGVVVRAGTKPIAVGFNPAVTATTGFLLAAGEQSPVIHTDNLAKVWVVGAEASSDYSFLAE